MIYEYNYKYVKFGFQSKKLWIVLKRKPEGRGTAACGDNNYSQRPYNKLKVWGSCERRQQTHTTFKGVEGGLNSKQVSFSVLCCDFVEQSVPLTKAPIQMEFSIARPK